MFGWSFAVWLQFGMANICSSLFKLQMLITFSVICCETNSSLTINHVMELTEKLQNINATMRVTLLFMVLTALIGNSEL